MKEEGVNDGGEENEMGPRKVGGRWTERAPEGEIRLRERGGGEWEVIECCGKEEKGDRGGKESQSPRVSTSEHDLTSASTCLAHRSEVNSPPKH